ncbi:50S ribosomal protein L6 [Sulfurospirillum sp. hDNRA2]|uniref:50S ribosomal protein L6 n=1 Tax=Sulfurospirillum sp. hDNRA2 TaxID=3237298 RepID=UPI0020B75E0D|nr:50S ribosomal protein L6 [Sulfurospirillum sp. DNRA8]MCP3652663.1 50S ribosomal protein L6 [Sulfurospirillum sp. DNRA8]MCR1811514.1 50S ribosomal protein L6 [Sulfurospirillum sp. DNRA8]
MSRIGKKPVKIPAGLEVSVSGDLVEFKKGSVQKILDTKGNVEAKVEDGELVFAPKGSDRQSSAFWGTYRALGQNIVIGLTEGFKKQLEINGVGYRAAVSGNVLELQLGFSHPINYEFPKDVQIVVEKNVITVQGNDKQVVGQIAAEIRSFRAPEPYKGKGVKYSDETIIRKAGKTSKK